jgi:hypothetical protein
MYMLRQFLFFKNKTRYNNGRSKKFIDPGLLIEIEVTAIVDKEI